jgi:thioredoxin 2
MSDPEIVSCPDCGQKNRVRGDASLVPHCGKCGRPLPWEAEASAGDFKAVVEDSPLLVLIDFWAPWCGPCRIVEPAVEQLSRELAGRLKVAKVNTDVEPGLGQRFEISGIPALVLMEGGREKDRVVGALNYDALRRWVDSRLGTPSPARP